MSALVWKQLLSGETTTGRQIQASCRVVNAGTCLTSKPPLHCP